MSDARSKFMIAMAEGKVTWLKVEELGAKMMIQFRTPANHCSPRGAVDRIYTCKDFEAAWEQLEELYAQKPPAEEPQSDEVPTITLPYQPQKPLTIGTVNTWEYAIGTNALTIRCACGAELPIEKGTIYLTQLQAFVLVV